MADPKDNFKSTISAVFAEQSAVLRQNYSDRELLHSKFEKAWAPLIDHMKDLAERYLPEDKGLEICLKVDQSLEVSLQIHLSGPREQFGGYWSPIDSLYLRNTFHPASNKSSSSWCFANDLKEFYNKKNGYTWFWNRQNRSPDLALQIIGKERGFFHPDDMEEAKQSLEKWLATQIAFNFDQSRIYPKSTLEITMKRKNPGPDEGPS